MPIREVPKDIARPGPASGPGPGGAVRVLSGFCPGSLNGALWLPGALHGLGTAPRPCPGVSGPPAPFFRQKIFFRQKTHERMGKRPKCQPGAVKRGGAPGAGLGWDLQTYGPIWRPPQ